MRVTPPVTINDAKLISSNAAEPHAPAPWLDATTYAYGEIISVAADYAIYESLAASNLNRTPKESPLWWRKLGPLETAYSAATTYALGATVYSASTHRCYESLVAGNVGNPLPVPPETATDKWLDIGPTNRWAMFDLARNTQTVRASPLTLVVAPGQRINTIGILGLVANSVTISATSATYGGTVYPERTFDLNTRRVYDHYDYAFEPFSTTDSVVVFDVPPYSDIVITIAIAATVGNVKCGSIIFGTHVFLGDVKEQAKNDGVNFSKIERDAYGAVTLIPRRTIPKTTQTLLVDAARINKLLAVRDALNAVPALWTGLDNAANAKFEMLTILGIYKQFEIVSTSPNYTELSLELEEI